MGLGRVTDITKRPVNEAGVLPLALLQRPLADNVNLLDYLPDRKFVNVELYLVVLVERLTISELLVIGWVLNLDGWIPYSI